MQALANASLQFSRFSSRLAPRRALRPSGPRVYARRPFPDTRFAKDKPDLLSRTTPRERITPAFGDPSSLSILAQPNPDTAVLTPIRPDTTEPPPTHQLDTETGLANDTFSEEVERPNTKWQRISVPVLDKPLPGWNKPHLTKIRKLERGSPGIKVLLRKPIQSPRPGSLFGKSEGVVSYIRKISWCINFGTKELGLYVPPDGYIRVKDLTDRRETPRFPRLQTPARFAQFVNEHCERYFRTKTFLEWVDGKWKRNIFVRSLTHTPDVKPHKNLKRITLVDRLPVVVYLTGMRNWEYIRRHGIPQSGNRLILLSQKAGSDIIDIFPRTNQILAITIDAEKAIKAGVLFFHNDENQLCAAAPPETGYIPLEAFKGVVQLVVNRKGSLNSPHRGEKT